MSTPTPTSQPDARAEALVAAFERAGYRRVAPAILQPAEPFLDLSGEDIRKRMYLTTDPQGHELCLRPDLTIPVPRHYLASSAAGKPQSFCYLGPVFRHRDAGASEFLQAGIESFGRADTAAADAEMLALGIETTAHYGLDQPDVRMGDVALFSALVAALGLSRRARCARRLRSERRACPRYRSPFHRRHHHRRRALGGRDRRSLPRAGGAWRADLAAARYPYADREIPRDP